jgi:hypothetical protein
VGQTSEFAARLVEPLQRALAWAEEQSQVILRSGKPLDGQGLKVARAVGVMHPERIRLWIVPQIPAPEDPELRRLALEQNLIGPGTRGLTLAYGIIIRDGELDAGLLSHECRHVSQVEQASSLLAFLTAYLKQIAEFTYDDAPYERDARAMSLPLGPRTDRIDARTLQMTAERFEWLSWSREPK